MNIKTFYPGTSTVNITASATSQNISLGTESGNTRTVRVVNSGTVPAFIHFTNDATFTATTTASMPVLAGATETFSKGANTRAAIVSTGTPTVYFTCGEGL